VPPRLREGDLVGVFAASSPVAAQRPRRFERGLAELRRRGFRVRVAERARAEHGHTAGTVDERVADLHALWGDREVRCVLSTIGGYNTNALLDRLDYGLLRDDPKVICGYSDTTALLAAVWTQTGLAVTLGPALMPQFGEHGGIDPYSWESFERTLMRAEPAGPLPVSAGWTAERLAWDSEDERPRRLTPNAGPRGVRPGVAEGPLVAGNLRTLLAVAGTRFFPSLDGVLLCLEDDAEESIATVDRSLAHLRLLGAFDRIAGLALGRFEPASGVTQPALDEVLLGATAGSTFPIVADLDFGHTDPMACLPWGMRGRLVVDTAVELCLLEPAVAA
jgi:muramoyltetrapeptide carboxypeptidase